MPLRRIARSTSRGRVRPGLLLLVLVLAGLLTILALNFTSAEQETEHRVAHSYAVADPQFRRVMGTLLGPPIAEGNRVQTLLNGDQIFPSMLEAIAGARETIDFETYIYWGGDVGRRFAEALSERARAGVEVNILIDWVGSQKIEEQILDELRNAGAHVHLYRPLRWYQLRRMNRRTHRKLLVVDGRVGFTGGVGIADEWSGHAQDPDHWRDTHFRAEGPVVAQIQAAFLDNWVKVSAEVPHDRRYFRDVPGAGQAPAQMFSSSARGGSDSMQLMYLLAIAAASRSIKLEAAYFVPDEVSIATLVEARRRGVEIDIIVPGELIDTPLVRHASRATWGPLLAAGVRIHEYQPTMFHCKVMVVDSELVSVGSTNFDPRSFRLNDEANLNVYDREFAAEQERVFAQDLAQAREVTLQQWEDRPWRDRLQERVWGALRSQL